MSLIKSFIEKRETISAKTWASLLGLSGNKSNAGVSVNATTAMRQSAVFACVHLLASTFAYVPWITYKRLPRGKERASEHPLYSILHDRPNPEQNSFTFRSTAKAHALLYGNGLAEIEFDNRGLPVALWPLPPWRVKPLRTTNQELYYQVTLPDGGIKNLPPYRVWHLMGLSTDGIWGMSVIGQARESIGLALATEEFGARFFSGGANVGGVAQHPGKLTKQGHENLQKSLDEEYRGLGKSHRLLLLEEGMKYEKTGIPNNDSQFLETRNYQTIDIARMFRVPPHMIAELTRATFSNIEEQGIEFVVYTMNPWFVNAEQETNYKLFGSDSGYFSEFLVDGLLRGDAAARSTFYKELFYLGSLSPNDIREKENMNPIEDPRGDDYYIQANMMPMSMVGLNITQGIAPQRPSANAYQVIFEDAIKRIVAREKQNLSRSFKKNPESFGIWLEDFYRDFPEFIMAQVKPVFEAQNRQNEMGEFINRYIDLSKSHLKEKIQLDDWEQLRLSETINSEEVNHANTQAT